MTRGGQASVRVILIISFIEIHCYLKVKNSFNCFYLNNFTIALNIILFRMGIRLTQVVVKHILRLYAITCIVWPSQNNVVKLIIINVNIQYCKSYYHKMDDTSKISSLIYHLVGVWIFQPMLNLLWNSLIIFWFAQ